MWSSKRKGSNSSELLLGSQNIKVLTGKPSVSLDEVQLVQLWSLWRLRVGLGRNHQPKLQFLPLPEGQSSKRDATSFHWFKVCRSGFI